MKHLSKFTMWCARSSAHAREKTKAGGGVRYVPAQLSSSQGGPHQRRVETGRRWDGEYMMVSGQRTFLDDGSRCKGPEAGNLLGVWGKQLESQCSCCDQDVEDKEGSWT